MLQLGLKFSIYPQIFGTFRHSDELPRAYRKTEGTKKVWNSNLPKTALDLISWMGVPSCPLPENDKEMEILEGSERGISLQIQRKCKGKRRLSGAVFGSKDIWI